MRPEVGAGEPASGDSTTGKRQALIRAGAGLSLIALLFGLLALVDTRHEAPGEPGEPDAAPVPQLPVVASPAAGSSAPLVGAALALPEDKQPATLPPAAEPNSGAPEMSSAPAIAPPGAREADEPPPSASPEAAAAASGESRLVLRSLPEEPDAPPPDQAVEHAAVKDARRGGGKGFLLQLGVFGDGGNAQALYEELLRQGVPARLETRVVAGPFATRESAAAARERLARAGMARGLVVPER